LVNTGRGISAFFNVVFGSSTSITLPIADAKADKPEGLRTMTAPGLFLTPPSVCGSIGDENSMQYSEITRMINIFSYIFECIRKIMSN